MQEMGGGGKMRKKVKKYARATLGHTIFVLKLTPAPRRSLLPLRAT